MVAVTADQVVVELEAKVANYNRKVADAERRFDGSMRKMQRSAGLAERGVTKATAAIGAGLSRIAGPVAVGAATTALLRMGRQALDTADRIDKLAISADLSRESVQTLSFAAEQLGVDSNTALAGFERFARRIGEFKETEGGPAKDALEELGIAQDVLNGKFPSTEAALRDVIKRLGDYEDQTRIAALAAKLFGDEVGPKFARLLAQGAEGINKLEQEARDLGLVMEDDLIAKSVAARDKLDALSATVSAKATVAFAQFAPEIDAVATALLDVVRFAGEASTALSQFDAKLDNVAANSGFLGDVERFLRDLTGVIPGGALFGADNPFQRPPGNTTTGTPLDPNTPDLLPPSAPSAPPRAPDISKFLDEATSAKVAKIADEMDRIQRAIDSGTLSAEDQARALEVLAQKQAEINKLRNPKAGGGKSSLETQLEREQKTIGDVLTGMRDRATAIREETQLVGLEGTFARRLSAEIEILAQRRDAERRLIDAKVEITPEIVAALDAEEQAVRAATTAYLDKVDAVEIAKDAEDAAAEASEKAAQAQHDIANGALDAAEALVAAAKGTQSWEDALIQLLHILLRLQQSGALASFGGLFGGGVPTLSNSGNAFGSSGALFNSSGGLIESALTPSSGGGLLDDIFGGLGGIFGLATGGPVSAGRPYEVAEAGDEIFQGANGRTFLIPEQPGRILNNMQTKQALSGGQTINASIVIKANDVESFRRSRADISGEINRVISRAARYR